MKITKPKDTRINARKSVFKITKIVLFLVDVVLINASILFGFWLRIHSGLFKISQTVPLGINHIVTLSLITIIILYIFKANGLYREVMFSERLNQSFFVVKSVSLGMILLLAFTFMSSSEHIIEHKSFIERRSIIVFAWFFLCVSECVIRSLIVPKVLGKDIWRKRVLILGAGEEGEELCKRLKSNKKIGFDIIGFLDDDKNPGEKVGEVEVLGKINELEYIVREQGVGEVFVSIGSISHDRLLEIIKLCKDNNVGVRILSDLFEILHSKVRVETLGAMPIIRIKEMPLQGLNMVLKRALDFLGAVIGLIILSPFIFLIGFIIKLTSKGPTLFVQERVGKDLKKFKLIKFRTMKQKADSSVHKEYMEKLIKSTGKSNDEEKVYKLTDDERVTKIGKFLRRFSLDELPQLFNVVKGDLSLVGPRPAIPYEVEMYSGWHRKRFEVLPGLTGLWQVSGRNEVNFNDMVILDIYYIENWSFFLDFKIILKTIPAILFKYKGL